MDKKDSDGMFDVTMGSYDGAEPCELVGAYLSCQLPKEISRNQIGDDLERFQKRALFIILGPGISYRDGLKITKLPLV